MSSRQPFTRLAALALTALVLTPATAMSALEAPQSAADFPRGWSAVAGMDTTSVIDMAATVFPGEMGALDEPYCDADAAIARTLAQDFGESLIDATRIEGRDAQLWGSPVLGTWTLVLMRQDATSCIVASGIGFSDGASPSFYYAKAGMDG